MANRQLERADDNVPDNSRNLEACKDCKIILSSNQWRSIKSCPNCGDVTPETTSNFGGMVSVMDSKHSWVARYNEFQGLVPGIYAIQLQDQQHNPESKENSYEREELNEDSYD
ncbi:UNKNOWN [Stylonychia lemnae]|uniref:Spt4/RpoE2 zinc finger domain-containing protein n=1 Tax=Stylonychia lemnae TaxID=5949 RepID=A0A078AMQ4_STYLE|nr:UNKNOWN [Stylonychia lemnae]|eukprot:CDW83675.1 UNKNOWN [Stylonychia lemnae]